MKFTDKLNDVDKYINSFPNEVKEKLLTLRRVIREEVPNVTETISYRIPTFKLNGRYLIYIAGFKDHVSIYPITSGDESIKGISEYRTGKGTLQFTLDKPLPLELIREIVKIKIKENIERTK